MTTHHLKTWPCYFNEVVKGVKTFEVRRDDRGFEVGDVLHLHEWDPRNKTLSERSIRKTVTYILRNAPHLGIEQGFVIMGLGPGPADLRKAGATALATRIYRPATQEKEGAA